jgi:hypothetical protein
VLAGVLFAVVLPAGAAHAAPQSLPANLVGTWTGTAYEPASRIKNYETVMTLRPGGVGEVVGSISYPPLNCSGTLTLLSVNMKVRVQEKITKGIRNCVALGEIDLRLRAGGALRWEYHPGYDLSQTTVTATLRKKSGCQIDVRSTPVPISGVANHLLIVFTDAKGTVKDFQAGPESRIPGFFGVLEDKSGEPDYPVPSEPSVTAMSGDVACGKYQCLSERQDRIFEKKLPYQLPALNAYPNNSNAFVYTLLYGCQVPTGKPNVRAPGWGTDLLSQISGTWEGSYVCRQGKTGLRLTASGVNAGRLTATFEFYALPENPGVPSGSFTMRGSHTGQKAALNGARWVKRPIGYVMVGLNGSVSGDHFAGSVRGSGCGTFSLDKV